MIDVGAGKVIHSALKSQFVRFMAVGILAGIGVGTESRFLIPTASPIDNPLTIDRWPSAARTIIGLKDKTGEAQGFEIVAHHVMPSIQTKSGGTVWTTVEEAKDPNGRNIFVPFSIELNEQSELVDVN